jgi:nucleoside-diphosphate-sugar epimerase
LYCLVDISALTLNTVWHSSYGPGENRQVVNENSPVADTATNPRSARLIHAEQAVLKNGGSCVRLAGLYSLDRGAHNYWISSGKDVSGRADGIINQVHYDDAAGAVVAAVVAGPTVASGNVFLISDGHPMTRKEICESTLKAKKYEGKSLPEFLGTDKDSVGKIYDGAVSNKALKWDPRYESFDSFMSSQ